MYHSSDLNSYQIDKVFKVSFDLVNIEISSSNIQFAFSIRNILHLFQCHSLENIFHLPRKSAIRQSEIGWFPVHLSVALLSMEVS